MDMNGVSAFSLPKNVITTLIKLCTENLMWILYKSFYVSAGFDTRMFYKAVSPFLDPVTKAKMSLTAEKDPAELRSLYHPS